MAVADAHEGNATEIDDNCGAHGGSGDSKTCPACGGGIKTAGGGSGGKETAFGAVHNLGRHDSLGMTPKTVSNNGGFPTDGGGGAGGSSTGGGRRTESGPTAANGRASYIPGQQESEVPGIGHAFEFIQLFSIGRIHPYPRTGGR